MKPNRNESERQQARAENALFEAVMSLESVEECRNFLKDLCTPAELQALADRWEVCRDTIWRWSKLGLIPQPVKLGPNCTRWVRRSIVEHEDSIG